MHWWTRTLNHFNSFFKYPFLLTCLPPLVTIVWLFIVLLQDNHTSLERNAIYLILVKLILHRCFYFYRVLEQYTHFLRVSIIIRDARVWIDCAQQAHIAALSTTRLLLLSILYLSHSQLYLHRWSILLARVACPHYAFSSEKGLHSRFR
jgi:hypothetical protein